jgi:FixJ family two-component response regulator
VTVPVLIMSAHIGGDVAERASRMGSAGFIAKPLDEQALIEAISVALAQG